MEVGDAAGDMAGTPNIQQYVTPLLEELEFRAFYLEHYASLVRFLMKFGANCSEAEDIAQEAMLQLCRRWPDVEFKLPYAMKTACNRLINQARSDRARELRQFSTFERPPADPDYFDDLEAVEELLSLLTPGMRQVAELAMEGYSPSEISDESGRPQTAIYTAFSDIRGRLQLLVELTPVGPKRRTRNSETIEEGNR